MPALYSPALRHAQVHAQPRLRLLDQLFEEALHHGDEEGTFAFEVAVDRPLDDAEVDAYRDLIHHEHFWEWFIGVSPIGPIAGLPIASRPVSRAKGGAMTFDGLRAIPWQFSWIQMRILAPSWYGLGAAFAELSEDEASLIRTAAGERTALATVLDNSTCLSITFW